MMFRALLCFLLLCATPALAQVSIDNYNGAGTAATDQVSHYDIVGNAIDAHDGMDLQVGTTYYKYGTAYGCGFVYQAISPYCGVNIYSSIDEKNWTPLGQLFDPTLTAIQNLCAGTAGGGGCFRPHMIANAANGNYVLWINQGVNATNPTTDAYLVWVCATPISGCIQQTSPTGLAHGPGGDNGLLVDTSGNAYVAYSNTSTREIWIDKLNANYTDSTGVSVDSGQSGEAVKMFIRSGTSYVVFGPLCAYCSSGVATEYVSASSPQGTYGSATTLNSNSCNGQNRSVDVIIAGANTTYLLSSDQWNGSDNEGLANIYYQPLTFSGAAINTYTCNNTITIPGLTPNPPTPNPAPDQTTGIDDFLNFSDGTTTWRMQTFVAGHTHQIIKMPLGQNCKNGVCTVAGIGSVTFLLTTVDGSNNPVTTLATTVLTSTQLAWSPIEVQLFDINTLTMGTTYAVIIEYSGTPNNPAFALYTGGTNPYPSGVERFSTNSGSTWSTEANRALAFSTFSQIALGLGIGPGKIQLH